MQKRENRPVAVLASSQFSSLRHDAHGDAADRVKRAFDVAIVLLFLLAALPLILLVVGALYALQGQPIFIKHFRLGKGGRRFPCLKFRTMVTDCDEVLRRHLAENPDARLEWEASRKLKDDPRVTPFGRVLRKSSVDELPQLMNVLRGEMSLVGPRPIVDAEVQHYGAQIQQYYRVRPGLTGRWQVSGRSDTSYKTRVEMDVDYIGSRSFGQDLMILAKTIPAVVSSRGSY